MVLSYYDGTGLLNLFKVSFDAADHMAYRTHLFEDHKITRNIDKILELSRQSELIKPGII